MKEKRDDFPIQLLMPLTPWCQLVTPVLVARCDARRVRPIADEFFKRWPTPNEFIRQRAIGPELFLLHVHGMLVPLGLASVRTATIDRIANMIATRSGNQYVPDRAFILSIPGCGRYVADSFAIFYCGASTIDPIDPVLKSYVETRRRRFRMRATKRRRV